jgi:hypothetical protein
LLERAGELVSKGELMARVWPDTFVEDSDLRVQVVALRLALRDGEEDHRGRWGPNAPTPRHSNRQPTAPSFSDNPPAESTRQWLYSSFTCPVGKEVEV